MAIKVNIGDTKWVIPERLTLEEWKALQQWEFENEAHRPRS